MSNLRYLLQRSFVSTCLDVLKMKALVPRQVTNPRNGFSATIVDVVFDPFAIEGVNSAFAAKGYLIPANMRVIAVNADESILLWGGANSVYCLRKGEQWSGNFLENLAFDDPVGLWKNFKTKNKKAEVDELHAELKALYADRPDGGVA